MYIYPHSSPTIKLHQKITTKRKSKHLHTWKRKYTSNKPWAKKEIKMKIINYLAINDHENTMHQSTWGKTYSLKCM